MTEPEFPKLFVENHCPKVQRARDYRSSFGLAPDPTDDVAYAECAFVSAGVGLECENCKIHLTRPYCGHKVDEEFLPQIEKYYRDMRAYEAQEERRLAAKRIADESVVFIGAYI